MRKGLYRKFYSLSGQFFYIEKEERSDEQESWIPCIENPDRKMIHHVASITDVKHAECKSHQQH